MQVKFWGVRGSIPSPGKDMVKYGGNTACVEVKIDDDYSVVFDAGSGIRELGKDYLVNKIMKGKKVQMSLFITHTHWDHIQGFPFFVPAFIPSSEIKIVGAAKVDTKLESVLKGQQQYTYFPIALSEMKGKPTFMEIEEDQKVVIGKVSADSRPELGSGWVYGIMPQADPRLDTNLIHITSKKLNHPFPGVFSYRLEYNGKVVVMATDTEHYSTVDSRLVQLAKDADVMIYDCQYTDAVYNKGQNLSWGHSTPTEGIKVAKAANVKKLVMFHYDPNSTDETIDGVYESVKNNPEGIEVIASYEGLEIEL